jgi:hypothetical protein
VLCHGHVQVARLSRIWVKWRYSAHMITVTRA